MKEKIKVIIADDNKSICEFIRKYLEQYEEIEILGVANTDDEEIDMIEKLQPEIVITDLMRNYKYTGLDIIKKYYRKQKGPEFLVISADRKQDVINNDLEVAGYIQKIFMDYDNIYMELKKIKEKIKAKGQNIEFEEWQEKYWNDKVIDINKYLTEKDCEILKDLGITIENKIYTMQEYCAMKQEFYLYYEDEEDDEESKEFKKNLEDTGVTKRQYNSILNKINEIDQIYNSI